MGMKRGKKNVYVCALYISSNLSKLFGNREMGMHVTE